MLPDFYEVWEKEIWKKRIAIAFAVFFAFLFFTGTVLDFLLGGEEKTVEDYAFEYTVQALNYTPGTAREAFFSPLQYTYIGYEEVIAPALENIRRLRLVSFFKPTNIRIDREKKRILVDGWRVTGKLKGERIEDVKVKRVTVVLSVVKGKFVIEKIEEF